MSLARIAGAARGSGRCRMGAALAVVALLLGCDEAAEQARPAPPPPAVGVTEVQSKDVTSSFEFVGRIQAVDTVDLIARVEGFLDKRLFTEGQVVKAGDLLFQIEKDQFEAQLDQAKANVAAAQADYTNAQLQYQRAQALGKNQNISQATVDQRLAEQQTAEAKVLQTQAAQREAEINLAYTDIHAPIEGRIGQAAVSEGNLVGPGTGVLATIVSQDPIYVTFPVSQTQILTLRKRDLADGKNPAKNAVVRLKLSDGSMYEHAGTIDFADNQVDQSTDTLLIRASFPDSQGLLVSGQFASVVVEEGEPQASLVIPVVAAQTDQAGAYVLLVDDQNKVEQRRITSGPQQGLDMVVQTGLKAGEKVIVDGIQKVRPGQVVQPSEAQLPAAGA